MVDDEREPKTEHGLTSKCGIAYKPRGSWRRSTHSTQMIRVTSDTRGRGAGLWECPRPCGGCREPQGDKRSRQTTSQVWRAVCVERCPYGSGGGSWKREESSDSSAMKPRFCSGASRRGFCLLLQEGSQRCDAGTKHSLHRRGGIAADSSTRRLSTSRRKSRVRSPSPAPFPV